MHIWSAFAGLLLFMSGCFCLVQQSHAQLTLTNVGGGGVGGGGGFTPSCSQSSAFLARATDITLTADKTNVDTLICGLVTDGVWAQLDAMWVSVVPTSATALLNWTSSSFSLAKTGTVTFTAYAGWVGDAATGFYDTGYTPSSSGTNQTLNSTAFGSCQSNNRAGGQTWSSMGTGTGSAAADRLIPNFNGTLAVAAVNAGQFTATISNAQGLTVVDRSGATTTNYYVNGTSVASDATTSNALPNTGTMVLLAERGSTGTVATFSGDTIVFAFIGGSLGATLEGKLQTRLNTYMSAYSVSGC